MEEKEIDDVFKEVKEIQRVMEPKSDQTNPRIQLTLLVPPPLLSYKEGETILGVTFKIESLLAFLCLRRIKPLFKTPFLGKSIFFGCDVQNRTHSRHQNYFLIFPVTVRLLLVMKR